MDFKEKKKGQRWTVLTKYPEVDKYLDVVREQSDANRDALGFLPNSAYLDQALKGRLWVIVDEKQLYAGHLIFGGRYPTLKIFHVLGAKQYRKSGIGTQLVGKLIEYGEANSYLSIYARVAADLSANKFWERMGFALVRQERGGQSSKRTINIRVRELETPSLLKQMGSLGYQQFLSGSEVAYTNRPILNIPSYAIDLNVLFDLIREREYGREAEQLFGAALAGKIRLCVTAVFSRELERRAVNLAGDPLLAFVKGLPTLPDIQRSEVEPLAKELSHVVFPGRGFEQLSHNDKSDLDHLAECIHHKVLGFVTSEKSLLRASDAIREVYGIDITSPVDLASINENRATEIPTYAQCEDQQISLRPISEAERSGAEEFLISRVERGSGLRYCIIEVTRKNRKRMGTEGLKIKQSDLVF